MTNGESGSRQEGFAQFLKDKIENLRPKLLDLTRRNPMISTRLSRRSGSFVQIVDELPDVLAFNMGRNKAMRFVALPSLDDEPKDEQTRKFSNALSEARQSDETYLKLLGKIDLNATDALDRADKIERECKDRVRDHLGMPPRASKIDKSLLQHAKNNDISPSFELPRPEDTHKDGRHKDNDIQTLLLPHELERKLNGLSTKCRTWREESGINVLHAAFGFLEWKETNSDELCLAPLILLPVVMEKKRTREGAEFWVTSEGEEAETNLVLAEKFKIQFGIDLPTFEGGSIEDYLALIADSTPAALKFQVRRQVVFGVFPSSRMAMYHDLDTLNGAFEQSEILTEMLVGSEEGSETPFADEYEIDAPEIEQKVPSIVMDADSSQFSVLVDLAEGRNLAVEGPPGTGKSQTIVNAIACALAAGKKILFIADKTAALNVVKARLEFVGLGEFVLPLQAERSAKAQVIQSIRDRVEMETKNRHGDLEKTLEQFRKHRADLAEYVAVIAKIFGNSGLTVHEILGRNIATQGLLAELPPEIQKIDFERVEDMSASQILTAIDAAASLQRSWEAVRGAHDHWDGLTVNHIDKFLIQDICEVAQTAAKQFGFMSELEQDLNGLGVEKSYYDLDLKLLKTCLDDVDTSQGIPEVELVTRLFSESAIQNIEEFLSECETLRILAKKTGDDILNPNDVAWVERLAEIERICISNDFRTLNLKELQGRQTAENKILEELNSISIELEPFFKAFPECCDFPIGDIQCAGQIVAETSDTVLGLRNETTASPEAAVVIKKSRELVLKLTSSAVELGNRMSLTAERNPQHLRKLASQIAGAGALRFLSSAYRSARLAYMELSYSNQYDRVGAVSDLKELADWLDEKERFFNLPALDRILGPYNLGMDTDFSAFGELLNFFENVEKRLPGIEKLGFRRILKQGDQNLLIAIPQSLSSTWEGNYESLRQRIEELSRRKKSFEGGVKELSVLLSDIPAADRIGLSGLRLIQGAVARVHQIHAKLGENGVIRELLQDRFKGPDTCKSDVEPELSISKILLPAADLWKDLIIKLLRSGDVEIFRFKLGEFLNSSRESETLLRSLLNLTGQKETHFRENRANAEISDFLEQAIENSTELYEQSAFATALNLYSKVGHPELANIYQEKAIDLTELPAVTEALIARSLAKRMYRDFGSVLGRFQGTLINDLRKKLAAADRKIIALTRQMLRHRIKQSANPPPGIKIGKKSQWTEWGLIENEINKKAKFVPVRNLTARAGKALQELKPCWMMSPLAVAQYIPRGTVEFDLCIIDEASQMRPEDAIGGLVRSKQAMIVGDTNQLPPSNFFRMVNDDEDADEDQTVLEESILELANASFRPKRRLRWHYRSRHSALINFSNRLVYDDDLIVFPSAHEGRKDMGVSLVYVDGVFKSGVNGIESQTMVDAALDFMEQNPHRSLGIVTMNQPQRDLLLEEMEYALVTRKKATDYIDFWSHENGGLESFFIKNLENVQGDERDVIFIGTVYGPAQPGAPVMQRFGPVNGLGGKRRLNVLFTRAKEQIITFSSMTAADVRADENGNPGTYMLKRWLEYSATGVLESGRLTGMEPDSEFEVFVIDQIKAMGYEAIPQIGVSGYFIDIGVKHPSWPHGFILGVECDGASYHSSKSARDRDRLRQEVLEGLGWHFHRIWSTDWFNDTARAALRLRDAITQRLEDLKKEGDKFSQNLPELPSGDVGQPREHDYPGQEQGNEQQIVKEENYGPGDGVGPGDTVYVRYLNDPGKTLKVTLSEQKNDPSNGIIGTFEPLGEALLGSEEGEEIDVLIGNIVRRAIVDKVEREQDSDFSLSQYPEKNGATPQKTVSNGERSEQLRHSAEGVNSRQGESGTNVQEQNFVLQSPRLDPDAFYNPEYSFTLRELSVRIIDHFGPVTHKHLCQKITRMHGFKRTGQKAKEMIWAIIHKERQTQKDPFGEDIFWPRNQEPQKILKFRGLEVFGDERPRENVPYPEMLGLALDAISTNNRRERLASLGRGRALDYMVKNLGLGRLTASTRAELEGLLQEAERVKGNDEASVEAL